jgi:ubiquinone/menaquinone biosynthesis C-methylase UbiE
VYAKKRVLGESFIHCGHLINGADDSKLSVEKEESMHKFSPENWQRLESEERRKLLPAEEILQKFGLTEGMTFLDVGAGTGYFSRAAAKIVGNKGKVLAADMAAAMVDLLKKNGVPPHVEILQSEEYKLPVSDSIADISWLAFVTHENHDVPRFIKEAARATKRGGKIVIVEWKKQDEEHGPPMAERLDQKELRRTLGDFNVVDEGGLNSSHYYIEIEVTK